MFLVGLTGGIGSGKSTIARHLAALGAVHIDADQLAREVVEPGTPALADIRSHFGDVVLTPDGELDRQALGSIVFADDGARAALNGIVHPAVRHLTTQRIAQATEQNPDAVVVYDVPLLVEGKLPHAFDLIVVAHAPAATRRERLVSLRGMTEAEAESRIAAQASDDERLAIADVVIDTGSTLPETLRQADELWADIAGRAGSAARGRNVSGGA